MQLCLRCFPAPFLLSSTSGSQPLVTCVTKDEQSTVLKWGSVDTLVYHLAIPKEQLLLSGRIGVAPGVVRRGLLVLLQTVLPYMIDRVGTSADGTELQADSVDWLHLSADTGHQQDPLPGQSDAGDVWQGLCCVVKQLDLLLAAACLGLCKVRSNGTVTSMCVSCMCEQFLSNVAC